MPTGISVGSIFIEMVGSALEAATAAAGSAAWSTADKSKLDSVSKTMKR
jgi:hypothetical protein